MSSTLRRLYHQTNTQIKENSAEESITVTDRQTSRTSVYNNKTSGKERKQENKENVRERQYEQRTVKIQTNGTSKIIRNNNGKKKNPESKELSCVQ